MNQYHVLEGERGICPICGIEAESIPVSTPVELEEYKERLKAAA